MRFMIMVRATADSEAGVMPVDESLMTAMVAYHEELAKAGMLIDASGLKPSNKGWRIRYGGGETPKVVDGPFAETKELIAGYTVIRAASRDEAVEWSRRFPAPFEGGQACEIEVRELYELEDFEDYGPTQRFRDIGVGGI